MYIYIYKCTYTYCSHSRSYSRSVISSLSPRLSFALSLFLARSLAFSLSRWDCQFTPFISSFSNKIWSQYSKCAAACCNA